MKYQSSNTKTIHDIEFKKGRHLCPECSSGRKKQKNKDLEYYTDTNRAYCHHCCTTFYEYNPHKKKEYIVPKPKNNTNVSDGIVGWFAGRMISKDTLIKMKVYTDVEYMPQFEKKVNVMCFPFFINDKLINIKYRADKKKFKLVSGAELVWYNYDALLNNKEIIICEGEMDALSFIECGFDNIISVPNGANSNSECLDNTSHLFDNIDKVYLATDNDTKGIELRDELIRRFGAEKCYIVNFKQYKDANEYLIGEGGLEFPDLIKNAKPVPVSGAITIDSMYDKIMDLYENGQQHGAKIGVEEIDKYCTWERGRLCVVTGKPSSGKSEVVDFIVSKLNLLHGWKAAYFTPENFPLENHYVKLHEKYEGKKYKKNYDNTSFLNVFDYLKNNFYYIMDEDDMSLKSIITVTKSFIKKYGIDILVIDPYNVMEHLIEKGITETRYISDFLNTIIRFCRFNNILTFLIAHPTKLGAGEIPTLYSISGSAHFYNKTDYGFTVNRPPDEDGIMGSDVDIYWQKIKFRHLGEQGKSEMKFNFNNGRYEPREDFVKWDNSNWITKEEEQITLEEFNEINDSDIKVNNEFDVKTPPF